MRAKETVERDRKPVNEVRFNQHPKRKNNDLVAAMYALYSSGKSLEEVGEVYRKTRQAVYDVFRTRGYPLRTKKLEGLQVVDGIRFTLTKGGYLRGTFEGKRILMHRYIWEKHSGRKAESGWDIHHKDGNKQNNAIENLEYMTKAEHSSKYSPHLNQFTAPNGSRRKKGDRIKALREAQWDRATSL